MPFCSIDEAFPDTTMRQGRIARKEERKRAEKCGGPALAFLKGIERDNSPDPDRKAEKPLPPPEAMNPKQREGFSEMNSVSKDLLTKKVNDVIGQEKDSYFGNSAESEGYADFTNSLSDNPGYQVLPADFLGTFGAVGANKASGKAVLTTPSVNDAWKPLTPSGARTSFFEYLPPQGGGGQDVASSESTFFNREDKEALLKKIDTLFAKLEDLESKHNEYAHTEITLFVLSGLFLLYGIESLKKIGRR
jgi:hypothetical protein